MVKAKIGTLEKLTAFIEHEVKSTPYSFDSFQWAALPQETYCSVLGISRATLRRYISHPPFVRDVIILDGLPVTLLRVGESMETPRLTAKRMAKVWRSIVGRSETAKDFGCFAGMAQVWPKGYQVDILKTVLKNWSDFMAGVDCAVIDEQIAGKTTKKLQFKYPHSPTILRFHQTALDLFIMVKQEQSADASVK